MAEENKKVPIAYATMPVEVTKEDGSKEIEYRKIHTVTTGNAVVVKDKDGNNKVLNKVLREHEEDMKKVVNTTYSELKALRDAGGLTPCLEYRITDYVTTTAQAGTRSAGHLFDIMVEADSNHTLNETAKACLHVGDTYFTSENVSSWDIKYCLDNDTERFSWADATNGKGVVWYMKDEFGNECCYDFKNIQFERNAEFLEKYGDCADYLVAPDNYYYTFCYISSNKTVYDASLKSSRNISRCDVFENKISRQIRGANQNDEMVIFSFALPNNIFVCYEEGNDHSRMIEDNTLENAYDNTFGGRNILSWTLKGLACYGNVFADTGMSRQNLITGYLRNNVFYGDVRFLLDTGDISYNTIYTAFNYCVVSGSVSNNTLNGGCYYSTFTGIFEENTAQKHIAYCNFNGREVSYCTFANQVSYCNFGGRKVSYCTFANQVSYCNFLGIIANCDFGSYMYFVDMKIAQYAEFTTTEYFCFYDVRGAINGTETQKKVVTPVSRTSTATAPYRTIDVDSNGEIVDYCIVDMKADQEENASVVAAAMSSFNERLVATQNAAAAGINSLNERIAFGLSVAQE